MLNMANTIGNVKLPIIYDKDCAEYHRAGHPERPQRVLGTSTYLRQQKRIAIDWIKPGLARTEDLMLAHTKGHIKKVDEPEEDFDGDTAAHDRIGEHARRSAGASIKALDCAMESECKKAFSLMRPPGHHSTPTQAMGFCYFSNAAIVALLAQKKEYKKIGIIDFDVHHGNGTEAVVLNKPNIRFASTHQSPCYPGTGLKDEGNNCYNYPIKPNTPPEEYMKRIMEAINKIEDFDPDLLVISAGFDAYKHDPIANELLDTSDFEQIGKILGSNFSQPSIGILEGGYSDDLPLLVDAFLRGWLDVN